MAALDTNVLIRFLIEDEAAQSAAAKRLIHQCVAAGEALYIPVSVTLELEWVLRSSFGFKKPEIVQTLAALLSAVELTFESESAVELALAEYSRSHADYSDCLHASLTVLAGEQPLWTFDKAAAKVSGARLLATQPTP